MYIRRIAHSKMKLSSANRLYNRIINKIINPISLNRKQLLICAPADLPNSTAKLIRKCCDVFKGYQTQKIYEKKVISINSEFLIKCNEDN